MASGFALGVIASGAKFSTDGSEQESTGDKELNKTEIQENVAYGAIFAEYSFGEHDGLTVGVSFTPMESTIGEKKRADTVSAAQSASTDTGTYNAKADVKNHAMIYIEPTMMTSDNFGVYFKGGLARVTVKSLESGLTSTYGDETVYGVMTGIGIKATHENGMGFKLEYAQTDYEGVELASTTGNKNRIEADIDQTATRLAIFYNF